MRRTPALLSAVAAAALLVAALSGCAQGPARGPGNQPAGCTPSVPSGDASSIVKATGAVGEQPKVSFPTPLVGRGNQVTVLKAGHGAPAHAGDQAAFYFTLYVGKTGKSIGGTGYDAKGLYRSGVGSKLATSNGPATSSIAKALVCAQADSRIAVTTTGSAAGLGDLGQYGIGPSDTVVVVVDVLETYPGKADGVNQLPQDGMPTVITAVDGQPGIVLQELDKPTTVRAATIKAGGGAVVKRGEQAILNIRMWTWPASGGKPQQVTSLDTWANGSAPALEMASQAEGGALPDKLVDAIIGQKVGSQVLVVLPPKDGFGDNAPSGSTAKDTAIFVVDVLGVEKK